MKKLPILTAVVVLPLLCTLPRLRAWQDAGPSLAAAADAGPARATQEPVPKDDPDALAILRQARDQLYQSQSVRADFEQLVVLNKYQFRSTGTYLAGGDLRYRLEYRVELRGFQGRFLEVCDGQVLHTRRDVSEINPSLTSASAAQTELTRREIQKILRSLRELNQQGDVTDAQLAALTGLGGLPAVLASLERSLTLEAVRPEIIEGREYLVVQGRWKGPYRDRLLAAMGGLAGPISQLLPDLVRVYFARETLFPEKFLYLRRASEERRTYSPMLTVEFRNVVLDQPIPMQQFTYVPPLGVEERDETGSFIRQIQQAAGQKPGATSSPSGGAEPDSPPMP